MSDFDIFFFFIYLIQIYIRLTGQVGYLTNLKLSHKFDVLT
jgi:hypothetical protein